MIADPIHFDPPLVIFSLLPLSLFVFKVGKLFYLYRTRVKTSLAQTLSAAVAGLALGLRFVPYSDNHGQGRAGRLYHPG